MKEKTLGNTTVNGAKGNVSDLTIYGDGDTFKLICKASSQNEGWMKSTKAMQIDGVGCLVQVTTQQKNSDDTYSIAESLTFVPGVKVENINGDKVNGRKLVAISVVEPEHNLPKGFTRYNGVNITRDAYQLKDEDTNNFGVIGSGRAMLEIAGEQIKFSFNCQSNQIKPGDFIVYLDDEDIYHCSEKVFTERNYV